MTFIYEPVYSQDVTAEQENNYYTSRLSKVIVLQTDRQTDTHTDRQTDRIMPPKLLPRRFAGDKNIQSDSETGPFSTLWNSCVTCFYVFGETGILNFIAFRYICISSATQY